MLNHHLIALLAFWIKSLFLAPTTCLLIYQPIVQRAVPAWPEWQLTTGAATRSFCFTCAPTSHSTFLFMLHSRAQDNSWGLPQPPLGPRSLLCFLHFLYIPSHSPWVSCLGLLERSLGEWQDCPTSGRLPSSMPKPRTLPRHPHHSLSSGISESHLLGNTFLDHPA